MIEPKYKLKDKVWFFVDDIMYHANVVGIKNQEFLKCVKDYGSALEYIVGEDLTHIAEEDLFSSKAALIKSFKVEEDFHEESDWE